MREPRKDRLTELVDAASGLLGPEVVRSSDRLKFSQFEFMLSRMRPGFFDAPRDVIVKAMAIVPRPERRNLAARLVNSTFSLAGARLEPGDEAQVVFEAEGTTIRVAYGRDPRGYTILGRIAGEDWWASCGEIETLCSHDGRFEFLVDSLEQTGVVLRSPTVEVRIPPIEETIQGAEDLDRPR